MIRVLINGICGQMGHAILKLVPQFSDRMTVVCGVDPAQSDLNVPVYTCFEDVVTDFDVVVDFSIPSASMSALQFCVKNCKPIVLCTTGFTPEQAAQINHAASYVPVFRSANMSVGINLLSALAAQASRMLGGAFDIEIIETHHSRKIDSPSGTAQMLAEAVADASADEKQFVYGRHDKNHRREPSEIGIHSLRGGTVVGEHEILFLGPDEVISLKHQAQSKAVFAAGALRAAAFLYGKDPGMYDMNDLIAAMI